MTEEETEELHDRTRMIVESAEGKAIAAFRPAPETVLQNVYRREV